MRVALAQLVPDRNPVRHTIDMASDAELQRSLAEAGQLTPLLVVPIDGGMFEVKEGNRRLRLAAAAGLTALDVHPLEQTGDSFTAGAAAAANMVRQALAPADQWRAMRSMQAQGHTEQSAAAFLGISERQAARLAQLGRLDLEILALIDIHGTMPSEQQLRIIANAPTETQRKAARIKGIVHAHPEGKRVAWHTITELCIRRTYQRAVAIFDTDKAKIAWDEDFFVPTGHPDQFTTTDAKRFLAAQLAALETQAAASKGRLVVAEESDRHPGEPSLPKGWRLSHSNPDRPKRNETVYACIATRTGALVRATAIDEAAERAAAKAADQKAKADTKAAKKATEKPAADDEPRVTTAEDLAALDAMGAKAAAANTPLTAEERRAREDADDDADASTPAGRAQIAEKSPLTKAGQATLAKLKTEGLRACLRRPQPVPDWEKLTAFLILALHAKNVKIAGYQRPDDGADWREAHQHGGGADIVRRIITPAGHLQYDAAELPTLAQETLARTLWISEPDAGYNREGSGDIAEWIAAAIDAARNLPPLDCPEILGALDAATLKQASTTAGQKFTTATAAKTALAGKLPDWRPDFAHYGAPGPKPAGSDAA